MGQRGRKSSSALTIVALPGPQRPKPLADLMADEAAVWRSVVDGLPPTWFEAESRPLLADYCRHVCRSRFLALSINSFEPGWLSSDEGLNRYDQLLRMAERESRAASSLATRLRLTQQSRLKAEKAATATQDLSAGKRPWDREERELG
jgi:hypothetical protein